MSKLKLKIKNKKLKNVIMTFFYQDFNNFSSGKINNQTFILKTRQLKTIGKGCSNKHRFRKIGRTLNSKTKRASKRSYRNLAHLDEKPYIKAIERMRIQNNFEEKKKELREKELREKELREKELREKELREKELREKELREKELREKELREKELREKELREKELKVKELEFYYGKKMSELLYYENIIMNNKFYASVKYKNLTNKLDQIRIKENALNDELINCTRLKNDIIRNCESVNDELINCTRLKNDIIRNCESVKQEYKELLDGLRCIRNKQNCVVNNSL